ncbi:uncharacterized protein LTR77_008511 [Saxophila tyrrhenica]|uniref:CENP-V/GFA domain-containing protein n=1 Tax=Saxophila tyrrhenica TaxID=1690608 RepID=A0AAV9P1M1_9PEZI|nr:hypothetical protein LTR77_008511 [Saxophila tyrrhenica]
MAPYMPLGGDGYSNEQEATATCFCGTVQIVVPLAGEALIDTFICHCADCRKITASMFASGFIVTDAALKHTRGEDKLTKYARSAQIASGNTVTNFFCSVCGTLMYRRSSGFPGVSAPRIGTVDDFGLHGTKLKPRIEQFGRDWVGWCKGGEGVEQSVGNFYGGEQGKAE